MAQLIVRNVSPAVVRALKKRAAEHGRSAEAEHRELLESALLTRAKRSLVEHLLRIPDVGTDEDFARDRSLGRKVDL